MELYLDNIGIIKDSTIKLDGLTVITGENNSGKSTVGKALYAVIDGFSSLEEKYLLDLNNNCKEVFANVIKIFNMKVIAKYMDFSSLSLEDAEIQRILAEDYFHYMLSYKSIDIEKDFYAFYNYVVNLTQDNLKMMCISSEKAKTKTAIKFFDSFDAKKIKAMRELDLFKEVIHSFNDNIEYPKALIIDSLKCEFNNEVKGNQNQDQDAKIKLSNKEEICCEFTLVNKNDNTKVRNTGRIFHQLFNSNVVLIDNPNILDSMDAVSYRKVINISSHLNPKNKYLKNHNDKLKEYLEPNLELSILDREKIEIATLDIIDKISKVLPGKLIAKNQSYFYAENNNNKMQIRIENIATGSKIFAIIKTLISKGVINSDTMLILDEPESHLHPEWQNILAEIVVLLVKELGVNILLTTHSINFMLAVETFMRKYEINDKTNFYMTNKQESGMVCYKCVNDSLNEIYAQFNRSYVEMYDRLNDMAVEDMVE